MIRAKQAREEAERKRREKIRKNTDKIISFINDEINQKIENGHFYLNTDILTRYNDAYDYDKIEEYYSKRGYDLKLYLANVLIEW